MGLRSSGAAFAGHRVGQASRTATVRCRRTCNGPSPYVTSADPRPRTLRSRHAGRQNRVCGRQQACVTAGQHIVAQLESGKIFEADALLYAVGRQGNSDRLNLETAGLPCDNRGRIAGNEYLQTSVPHISAAGDVVGFPSLASASMEQGRLASRHMFGTPSALAIRLLPYGIYTIPEISTVGQNEQELTAAKVPYEVGMARFEEVAKAQMIGDQIGLLKRLLDPKSWKLLGMHVMGDQAAGIVHIGQAVLSLGATVEYFRDTVFNYPTLAEAYKVAALDGLKEVRR